MPVPHLPVAASSSTTARPVLLAPVLVPADLPSPHQLDLLDEERGRFAGGPGDALCDVHAPRAVLLFREDELCLRRSRRDPRDRPR